MVEGPSGACRVLQGGKGGGMQRGDLQQRPYIRETVHSALNLQCTIRAQFISVARGHPSQSKVLAMATDCSVPVSRDRCSPDKCFIGNV